MERRSERVARVIETVNDDGGLHMCAARGCGSSRELGGLYFEVAMCKAISAQCRPLQEFLCCPPIGPIDAESMQIPYRGVKIVERPDGSGMCDVIDWVGEEHYPNVLDFYYETANLGLSRHAPSNMNYSNLSPGSRILLVHSRAIITNADACYDALEDEQGRYGASRLAKWECRKRVREHAADYLWHADHGRFWDGARSSCSALWWEMVTGGEPVYDLDVEPRTVERTVGDTTYRARRWFDKHDGVRFTPQYAPGIFMRLPIQRFAAVKYNSAASAERFAKSTAAAVASMLPYVIVDE